MIISSRLVELMNYKDFLEYEIRLRETIRPFDFVYLNGRANKTLGTLKAALVEMENILVNIEQITKLSNMLNDVKKIKPLQQELEQNRKAKEAVKNIDTISNDVRKDLNGLQEQFFTQLQYCYDLKNKVAQQIVDYEERKNYDKKTEEFASLARNSLVNKGRVPFQQETLLQDANEKVKEHDEKATTIDKDYAFLSSHENTLDRALNALEDILKTPATFSERQNVGLQTKIKKEVANIKKALPPKVILVSKESLSKLRESDQLTNDLRFIQALLQNPPTLVNRSYWEYNARIDKIRNLLDQALQFEEKRKSNIEQERNTIAKKEKFATDAVNKYANILNDNQITQQSQIHIENGQFDLQAENERLKLARDEAYRNGDYEKARSIQETISANEKTIAGIMSKSAVTTLPLEYTDMKQKLKNMSFLYQNDDSQTLSNEGRPR